MADEGVLCSYHLQHHLGDLVGSNLLCTYSFDLPLWLEAVQGLRVVGRAKAYLFFYQTQGYYILCDPWITH